MKAKRFDKLTFGQPVQIEWLDANLDNEWKAVAEVQPELTRIKSVGFYLTHGEDVLVLCSDVDDEDETVNGASAVDIRRIVSLVELR